MRLSFRGIPLLLILAFPASVLATPTVLRHDLQLTLHPEAQAVSGSDRLTVRPNGARDLTLTLAPRAEVRRVAVDGREVSWKFSGGALKLKLPPDTDRDQVNLEIEYRAVFADPAPARPVNTEDPSFGVTGTIGPRGAFLGGNAGWYPEIVGSLPTFRLEIRLPEAMTAVSSGRLTASEPGKIVWTAEVPVRALALAAGPYRSFEEKAGRVPVYAFFYPESEEFAETYLAAVREYLLLYEDLFGPYPFAKFAVAENFFPTGYGYPSWTLLGSTVVRLPFIVSTSLGHEVAHSWWGNGVWVDYAGGNWSEGLTTYVADYLYKERASAEEAMEYRLKILRDYASLVPAENDLSLADFVSRTSAAEQAVGYGKSAMVFHMARRWVGDEAFWAGLHQVATGKLFRQAAWNDFADALGEKGEQPMTAFFRQWVQRPGAPILELADIRSERTAAGWQVSGLLKQQEPVYRLRVPIRLETTAGMDEILVETQGAETPFRFSTPNEPQRLIADPEADVFRRLETGEIPPSVNGLRGSKSLLVVAASGLPADTLAASRTLLAAMGQPEARILADDQVTSAALRGHDLLFLGLPSRRELLPPLPAGLVLADQGFTLEGENYSGDHVVLFAALPHPSDPERISGIFLPGSAESGETAARKIPHYGKYSYLAFVQGNNVTKGIWPASDSPMLHLFPPAVSGDQR